MEFKKYQHIERFGTDDVQSIELGECYVFPKIDGTNGTVYLDNEGCIATGSRNRVCTMENDNQGFAVHIHGNPKYTAYVKEHPNHRLFGEFLIPHSLKTYREDAWRKFYVFDVVLDKGEDGFEYLPYTVYKDMLDKHEIEYIDPLCIIKNGSYEQFLHQLEQNTFLIEDGKGTGEGVVIKNYGFVNKYGRTTWAKIVKTEFKDLHRKTMGAAEIKGELMVEDEIVNAYCTTALIEKTLAKIKSDNGDMWRSDMIPRLLETVFHDMVVEDTWHAIKKFKNPTINFKTLKNFIIVKIKETKPELFA